MTMKRTLTSIVATIAAFAAIATSASADVTRSGNTFTASPSECSCSMVYGGYSFYGIAPNPTVVSLFGLPSDSVTVSDLIDTLRSDPDFGKVTQQVQTSVSVDTTVSGTVEEDPADDAATPARSSWG